MASPLHNLPQHKAWIFDFDGTLIDSMGALQRLGGHVIASTYAQSLPDAEEQYRRTCGLPFCDQIEVLYPGHPSNAKAVETFEEAKAAQYHKAQPFPETIEFLEALRFDGRFVAISSNNFQNLVEQRVDQLSLPLDLICGWHAGEGKGPAHFDRVSDASGLLYNDMIFVGDSLHDAALASENGVAFLGRTGTFQAGEFATHHPHASVIANFQELLT